MRHSILSHPGRVFLFFLLLLFLLYWSAASCGWVSDTLGWLHAIQSDSFADYLNRSNFGVKSFYQTTQLITWLFYQLVGTNHWLWFFLHLGLQALNGTLLFVFVQTLLADFNIPDAATIAFGAAILFVCSPYANEVIVWKAAFHYLQGMAFLLGILVLQIRYLQQPKKKYALFAFVLFFISEFALEIWYLTPVFCAGILLFYHLNGQAKTRTIRQALFKFILPQGLLFLGHLLLVRVVLNKQNARLEDGLWERPLGYFAIKPPMYTFELFGGRFLAQAIRDQVYRFFCTWLGAGLFYFALAVLVVWVMLFFHKRSIRFRVAVLLFVFTLCSLALITPLWFPERMLIVGDRYTYLVLPFFLACLVLVLYNLGSKVFARWTIITLTLLSCIGVGYLNLIWHQSEKLSEQLHKNFPKTPPGKQILLLNNPAFYKGAPMIGAGPDGEFRLQHQLFFGSLQNDAITDVLAANLLSLHDSVAIHQLSDSSFQVSLPNTASYWWYGPDYAKDYSTAHYRVQLLSPHSYRLQLLQPRANFILLFQQDGQWKQWHDID
ncbi:MAG: hypothetical protein JST36_06765 [Bacteroidetes bacterium]|nr:hypothetical protein [Bacteroidota bacterium]